MLPYIYHPGMSAYDFGRRHPFRGRNISDFRDSVLAHPNGSKIEEVICEPASDEVLTTVHSREYVERVKSMEGTSEHLSPDTWVAEGTIDSGKAVVGAVLKAVDLATDGNPIVLANGGFHHAGADYGEGFCIFNDVAIGVKYALMKGARKVAIIDTDAHQGNGTMDIFYQSPEVLFISIHQDPRTLYPGKGFVHEIGTGEGKGYTVNIPMFPYSGDDDYMMAMDLVIAPLIQQFGPDLIFRNGGSDPHFNDQLTSLGLSMNGFEQLCGRLAETASSAKAPLIDLSISGYGEHAIPGWHAIWSGTTGMDLRIPYNEGELELPPFITKPMLTDQIETRIDEISAVLEEFWDI